MANYYEILEIGQNASQDEIRQAYRSLARRWHPDRNPNNVDEASRRFAEISAAYGILSDEEEREAYDNFHFGFQTPEETFADLNESSSSSSSDDSDNDNSDFSEDFFGSATGGSGAYCFNGTSTFTKRTTFSSTDTSGPSPSATSNSTFEFSTTHTHGENSTTTKKILSNGIETTQVWENGQLISETRSNSS